MAWALVALAPQDFASIRVPLLCAESVEEAERARGLVQRGVDEAVIQHTTGIFRATVSGGTESDGRATDGMRNEYRGYFHARRIVAEFSIPLCKK